MANGENHAKQILIADTMAHVEQLENGSADDLRIIGRTIGKVARIACATFENNYRTVEDCRQHRKDVEEKMLSRNTPIKVRLPGGFVFEGCMTSSLLRTIPSIITCICAIIALAKWQKWL